MNVGIILFLFTTLIAADLQEGARCLLKDFTVGTCVKTFNCAPIMAQLHSGTLRQNPPVICSQTHRTVCCPLAPIPTPPPITALSTTLSPPQRISERKCTQYGAIVNQTVRIPSTFPGDLPVYKIIDKCKHKAVQLIVGGTAANVGEFPHQALLGYNNGDQNEWGCGGSLISDRFIITAAHCLYPRGYGAVKFAKLGAMNRIRNEPSTIIHNVMEIFQHPNYNKKTYDEDLGLLKLNETVSFSEFVTPICLPSKFYDANKAVVSGFGRTGFQQTAAENLLKVTLEKFTHEECQQTYGDVVRINNITMICYGHHTEKKDSCSGDSGGPLQIYNDKQAYCTYALIGVVSFGMKQCGTEGKPGVYVNVHHYLNWIEEIVWKDES